MTDRLRVAYIITGLNTGGAEIMLEKLLGRLSNSVQPFVLSLTGLGEVGPRLLARGVPVEALGMRPGLPNPLACAHLIRWIARLRPHVVHTWMYHADLLGGLAARTAGVRAVMWGIRHSNLDAGANKRSTLRVMRICARLSHWLPSRIACAGARTRDVHVTAGYAADRMLVIPNGFDLVRFHPDPQARHRVRVELGLPDATPVVGMVGRFDPQKNHRGMIVALTRLHALRPDVHAVMVGKGVDADNAQLRAWLHDAGLDQACHLLGLRDDIPSLMAALDVLMLPSIGEAFPNVVGEAMACGVPCAVTDVGDAADVAGDLGRVVAPGDMAALAHAASELLALSPAERESLSVQVRQNMQLRFDIGKVAAMYEAEYRSMAAASSRRAV